MCKYYCNNTALGRFFWPLHQERKVYVIRTEHWHEKDFEFTDWSYKMNAKQIALNNISGEFKSVSWPFV